MIDHERAIERLGHWIVDNPARIVLAFLLVTAVFAGGLGGVEIDSGTERFFESVPEHHTQQYVDDQFGATFETGEDTTQVIVTDENVFSKRAVLRTLELQQDLKSDPSLRVSETTGLATGIAQVLDPFATTPEQRIQAVETSTPAEVREAALTLLEVRPQITQVLSEDRNLREPRASATIVVVLHSVPEGDQATLEAVQNRIKGTAETADGDVRVFGSAIQQAGFDRAIFESLSLIVPTVVVFILLCLVLAYRDPIDLLLALVSLIFALVWTFGFMGYAGIKFNLMMIAVPVILLGVGIDFGIHAVNRYREERVDGTEPRQSMLTANDQLLVAFSIVTVTTVIGFLANVTSQLEPVREFGLVVAVGLVFTFFVFGIFLPALKLLTDHKRDEWGIGQFSITPFGGEDSRLGGLLRSSAVVAKRHPFVLLAVILLVTGAAGYSATNVESKFETEDFLPYADHPPQIEVIPDEIAPSEFEITDTSNYIKDTFKTTNTEQVTVYIEGPMEQANALKIVHRAGNDPPSSFVREDGRAVSEGIIDVIDTYASQDQEFAAMVQRNDLDDDGVPDRHLGAIYDELLRSEYADQAGQYLTEDRRATKVVYQVKSSSTQKEITADARAFASDVHFDAEATGDTIVFRALTEALMASAVVSFAVAFGLTAVFLVLVFWLLEDRWSLGLATMAPIVVAVVMLVGSMPVLGIAFNALTATILAITIGLGVAYSVHVVHRFIDEYDEQGDVHESLLTTLSGTGGGVTASMLTTSGSVACMTLAVNPILGQFGLLTAISTFYSYVTAIVVLPLALRAWARVFG
ncbi:efflux RND transporter permease subunit [Halapricum desulfuricans]|uniref:Putative exporter of the RND superfamily n=1 Tax=Halapricum desulfuricans TaxID=2841257 RepID=A0A897N467_9EURY|nr:MMPL family transporter [Halapricum desulfuricans]QSG06063.1 putative exporter of the RND superfamily [Halapricum desulfuricans]